jgi:hypothetical protein
MLSLANSLHALYLGLSLSLSLPDNDLIYSLEAKAEHAGLVIWTRRKNLDDLRQLCMKAPAAGSHYRPKARALSTATVAPAGN